MADRVGQQLGNYRLILFIKGGGFGEVYLGEHIHLGTQAAIKVLKTELASDADIAQFRTEARTIANLIHPHIVRVLEFGIEQSTPFLVMDYAPNGSLRQRHPRGTRLPLDTIVAYVKQIADALQYAHDQKLIHRDIKPENLLLGRSNEVLLSDFGIAVVAQNTSQQRTQGFSGTVAYAAPEQLLGKAQFSSDQYALGVVVYEWLCGELPFQGDQMAVAFQHAQAPVPPLSDKVPNLPPAVEQVVLKALAKDPQQRFTNIRAFADALEQANRRDETNQLSQSILYEPTLRRPSAPTPPYQPLFPQHMKQPDEQRNWSSEGMQSGEIPQRKAVSESRESESSRKSQRQSYGDLAPKQTDWDFGAPAKKRTSRNPLRTRLILALVVVLVVLGAGVALVPSIRQRLLFYLPGSGGSSSPTQSSGPSAFSAYRDPNHHFNIQYPSTWNKRQLPNEVIFSDSMDAVELSVAYTPDTSYLTAQQFADQEAQKAGVSTPDTKAFAGATWVERSGIVAQTSGIAQEIFLFVTVHNNFLFEVREVAPLDGYKEPNQTAFMPMLQSLVLM